MHTLQRLAPGDQRGLIAVIDAVCAEGRWMRTRRYEPTPAWEHTLNEPNCPDHLLLVARDEAQIVGWCRTFPADCQDDNTTASLGIGLLPNYRDRGIGTALVLTAVDWARDAGFDKITLTTQPDNHRAVHVFNKCGFAPSGDGHNGTIEMAVELGE
jgi:RimJ/RimL family protein N-acetyltransferase